MYFSAVLTHPFPSPLFYRTVYFSARRLPDIRNVVALFLCVTTSRSPFSMNVSVVGLSTSPFHFSLRRHKRNRGKYEWTIVLLAVREILFCRSFHSETGWVVERTHCVVEGFPGAAFTQIDTVVVVVVAFVCLLSRFARLPHNPTLYRFSSCELPRRSTSRRPLEPDSRTRSKNDRLQNLSLFVYRHEAVAMRSCRHNMALNSAGKM